MVAVLLIACATGGFIWAQRWFERKHRIERIRRERFAAAFNAYKSVEREFLGGELDVETCYLWSRRLLECQLEESRSQADRIAALRAHRQRLSALWDPSGEGKACWSERVLDSIGFYRREAELWLAQEQ
jgi:hypothetical protein